jgi:hypothetical protein
MKGWNNSSLGMYVDDGILFACAQEWEDVERLLRARYTICEEWLRRSGLAIEPDKTELLFFQKLYERNSAPAPPRLILPDPVTSSYYVVTPVENLRYLGFFINRRLKWEPHVRIMCNRARVSLKALQVLGVTFSPDYLILLHYLTAYHWDCLSFILSPIPSTVRALYHPVTCLSGLVIFYLVR